MWDTLSGYIIKRLLSLIPVLLVVAAVVFLIIHITPGNPAMIILGEGATPEQIEELNQKLGLDKPLIAQFFIWLANIAQGDFGTSYFLGKPVGPTLSLVLQPKLIICDEPVSALDVSIQAQIVNLLKSLQKELNLSYVFISHDLSVVRHIADKVGVMYLGNLFEQASTEKFFCAPIHEIINFSSSFVKSGVQARENSNKRRTPLSPKSSVRLRISPRCPFALDRCKTEVPKNIKVQDGRTVKCHLYEESQ